jgi:hypothetical protein
MQRSKDHCRPKPIVSTRKSQAETCRITCRCACSLIWHLSSRNDFNPHSHTFSIAARVRRTSGFLQVSLSKIRGYIDVLDLYMARRGFPINASDYTSTAYDFVNTAASSAGYAVRPFWGDRAALQQGGYSPADVENGRDS